MFEDLGHPHLRQCDKFRHLLGNITYLAKLNDSIHVFDLAYFDDGMAIFPRRDVIPGKVNVGRGNACDRPALEQMRVSLFHKFFLEINLVGGTAQAGYES